MSKLGEPLVELTNTFDSSFNVMHELRKSKKFCDLTLIVNEEKFHVHKVVLASNIPYFKEMFSSDKYEESHKTEIELVDLDPEIMTLILDFIYIRKIEVTMENLIKILHHADYLMMQDLKVLCEEQLAEEMSVSTCIRNYELSSQYHLEKLKDKAKEDFRENFTKICGTLAFLELPLEKVFDLWSDWENENIEDAYLTFINWVKYDVDQRKSSLSKLLEKIPEHRISVGFFKTHLEDEELLTEIHECSLWLIRVLICLADI